MSEGMDYQTAHSLKSRNYKSPGTSKNCIICEVRINDWPDRKFHGFPKNPELSNQWAEIIGKPWVLKASISERINRFRVCSSHFFDSDYYSASKTRLNSTAVPKLDISISGVNFSDLKNKLAFNLNSLPVESVQSVDNIDIDATPVVAAVSQSQQAHEKATVADSSLGMEYTPVGVNNKRKRIRLSTPKTEKIKKLSTKLYYLQKKHAKLGGRLSKYAVLRAIKCMVSPVIYNFISNQIKFSGISAFGRRWGIKDKNLALQLYMSSPKAYNSLRKWFFLPSVTTLRKCVSGIETNPGFNKCILESIKFLASKLKSHDKKCIISFDEMKLKRGLSYDIKYDNVCGFENYDSFQVPNPRLATHALVFMVRGLCKKWKQVFGYFYTCESASSAALRHLLFEGIREIINCDLDPIAVVCDQGANNQRLYMKELGVTPEKPHFDVELDGESHKVYALFDAPHLLKSVRNNFKKYNVQFMHKGLLKVADWQHVRKAWEIDSQMTHRMTPKLTRKHVEVDGLSAMNVKLAAQVMSRSVASILCYLTEAKVVNGSNTADFCAIMNDLFDSVNGRMIKHENPLLSAVSKTSPHLESWKTLTEILKSVEFQTQGKKIKFPCLQGWLITLSAFRQLIPELLTNIPYILMSRFSQDALENFFSVVRRKGGNNDHPTPIDFKFRVRMLMAEHIMNSCNTNCEPDEDAVLVPLQLLVNSEVQESKAADSNVSISNVTSEGFDSSTHDVLTDSTEIFDDNMHEVNSAAYVGGYVAHVALKKFQCTDCQLNLTKEKELSRDLLFIYFKEYDNVKSGLKAPSDSWLKTICEFGRSFSILFNVYSNKSNIAHNIICNLKDIDHDWLDCPNHGKEIWEFIVKKYVLLMLYYKLKIMTRDINNTKRVAKKFKKLA